MKFVVSTYRDEDGVCIAECLSIPGCVSQGPTEAEAGAGANIVEAIRECMAVRAELVYPLRWVPDHPEVVRGSLRACIAKTLYSDHAAVWFLEINRRDTSELS